MLEKLVLTYWIRIKIFRGDGLYKQLLVSIDKGHAMKEDGVELTTLQHKAQRH
jgi:hypothetical protein